MLSWQMQGIDPPKQEKEGNQDVLDRAMRTKELDPLVADLCEEVLKLRIELMQAEAQIRQVINSMKQCLSVIELKG